MHEVPVHVNATMEEEVGQAACAKQAQTLSTQTPNPTKTCGFRAV